VALVSIRAPKVLSNIVLAKDSKMERNKEVDRYIVSVSDEFRPLMTELRDNIFILFPQGEETFGWNIPIYKHKGKALFSIAAFQDHYSIVTQDHDIATKIPELANYKVSGTTIHFTAKQPANRALLEKIIQHRLSS